MTYKGVKLQRFIDAKAEAEEQEGSSTSSTWGPAKLRLQSVLDAKAEAKA